MNTSLVSICCVTYNHAQFIRKCLDGFLMQQTDFLVEILIHDDCSTDGTTEIIREYEAKYPDLIFPLYEEENQYQQGKAAEIDFYNYRRARGKYIAYCEGDDYWTDPLKLQKQVDFMEANLEYSVCFHGFEEYDVRNQQTRKIDFSTKGDFVDGGMDITPGMYLRYSYWGQPLTMMFRVSMFDFSWREHYKYYRDTHEIYHLLHVGKGRFMNFNGGFYIRHDGGIATSLSFSKTSQVVFKNYFELLKENPRDKELKYSLQEVLLWSYYVIPKIKYYQEYTPYFKYMPTIFIKVFCILFKRKVKKILKSNK